MARVHYLMLASASDANDWLNALLALGVPHGAAPCGISSGSSPKVIPGGLGVPHGAAPRGTSSHPDAGTSGVNKLSVHTGASALHTGASVVHTIASTVHTLAAAVHTGVALHTGTSAVHTGASDSLDANQTAFDSYLLYANSSADANSPLESDACLDEASLSLEQFGHSSDVWTRRGGRVVLNCRRLHFRPEAPSPAVSNLLSKSQSAPAVSSDPGSGLPNNNSRPPVNKWAIPQGAAPVGGIPVGGSSPTVSSVSFPVEGGSPAKSGVPANSGVSANSGFPAVKRHPCDVAAEALRRALSLSETERLSSPRLVDFLVRPYS